MIAIYILVSVFCLVATVGAVAVAIGLIRSGYWPWSK